MTPHSVELPYIVFNGATRYSRQGDVLSLFVDRIDNLSDEDFTSGNLCLQLWACQSPYSGGELTGWKLAELSLGVLSPGHFLAPVESEVAATFPEFGDFAIVLVVAEWDGEGFNRIHDYHNYPYRDAFIHPRLAGTMGYLWVDDTHLVLDVERIDNPRPPENMSGALALELWALPEPYETGDFQGHALGAVALGSLAGAGSWQNLSFDLDIATPPADTYTLVLMLREWNGNSYVTRDHCNFRYRVVFPIDLSATGAMDTSIAEGPVEQVGHPVQSAERVDEAPRAEFVEDRPAQEDEASAPEDIKPVPASPKVERLSVQTLFDSLKRFAQPLWAWLKQHW